MSFIFAIVTSPRDPFYLHDTIFSFKETGFFEDPENVPLRLLCSSKFHGNDRDLKPYKLDPNFDIEEYRDDMFPVNAEPSERPSATEQRDLCFNHLQGTVALLKSEATHLCIFEDDVKPSAGWLPRLSQTVQNLDANVGERWIMTLFARESDEPIIKMKEGMLWYRYDKRPYVGTQAIVYPRKIASEIMEPILERCVFRYEHPIDELLGHWADENNVPIVASAPSLIQHIGNLSNMGHGEMVTKGFLEEI